MKPALKLFGEHLVISGAPRDSPSGTSKNQARIATMEDEDFKPDPGAAEDDEDDPYVPGADADDDLHAIDATRLSLITHRQGHEGEEAPGQVRAPRRRPLD